MSKQAHIPRFLRTAQLGMSMVELMVALTISAVLVAGAAQVYIDSRKTYEQNEAVSRLQETARYALSIIETDARMANYWGLIQNSPPISGAATGQLVPPNALAAVASTTAANVCGQNFATDVTTPLQADNNSYVLSGSRLGGCDTLSGWTTNAVASADTLTVRHASVLPAGLAPGTLQLCSTQSTASLTSNGLCPLGAVPPAVQVNNVIVNAYYVDRNSQQQNGANPLPSLHRKALRSVGGAIVWQDEEVVAGVEDMQVEFGIDPGTATNPNIGTATRYVQPGDPILLAVNTQIVAIRIWVLVRSDTPETGFIDGRTYSYADRLAANGSTYNLSLAASAGKAFSPSLDPNVTLTGLMHYRRLLVSRTIQIRNTYRT